MDAATIVGDIEKVTAKWERQRRAEIRERNRVYTRRVALSHRSTSIKEAAWQVMERAYLKASNNGKLPAHARQIMYAARGEIQDITSKPLNDQYFTQTLLPNYIMENPEAATWNVVYDARGSFFEPHTEKKVPLGTIDVNNYLVEVGKHAVGDVKTEISEDTDWPTCGPKDRYGAILFVEKEGFMPLFKEVKLAQRYDLAIMSTKGLSVTASRRLVDDLCGDHDIPLLVLHDFDKAGFSILGTLQRDTRRYEFGNYIEVIDLGLRLADVQAYGLQSESVCYGKSYPGSNLRENGAEEDEVAFLCGGRDYSGYSGKRVELNAFTSADLVKWVEGKLEQHGIAKVVPDDCTLANAYIRAVKVRLLNRAIEEVEEEATQRAGSEHIPDDLVKQVRKRLDEDRGRAWDEIVTDLVAEAMGE